MLLESPHRGNSNEYTLYTIFNIKKKSPLFIPNLQLWDFSEGPNNEYETALVQESSVFEPLKFYCIWAFALPYFLGYKTDFFSFQNNPKDLDLSYKTDLDL